MSKYNHIKSIPIESIPPKKIKRAIKEWAEGNESLEKLLHTCYKKKLKTSGCHAGAGPFISFKYQENIDKTVGLLNTTQNVVGSQIHIMADGGNPFSGPDWFLPTLSIGIDTEYKDEADKYFDALNKKLEETENNKESHPLLYLMKFFIDKESGLIFRFKHKQDNTFIFYIETLLISDDRYKYYNNLFTKLGLKEVINKICEDKRYGWKIEEDKLETILKKMNYLAKNIIEEFSLEPETEEEKIIAFILIARFKRKKLSEKEFSKWLKKMKKQL